MVPRWHEPDARRGSGPPEDAHRSPVALRRCRAMVAARDAWIAAARVRRASVSTSTFPSCAQACRAWLSTSPMERAARPVLRVRTSSPARRVRADSAARARASRSSRDCSGTVTPRSSPPATRARSACRAEAAASSSSRMLRPYPRPPTPRVGHLGSGTPGRPPRAGHRRPDARGPDTRPGAPDPDPEGRRGRPVPVIGPGPVGHPFTRSVGRPVSAPCRPRSPRRSVDAGARW